MSPIKSIRYFSIIYLVIAIHAFHGNSLYAEEVCVDGDCLEYSEPYVDGMTIPEYIQSVNDSINYTRNVYFSENCYEIFSQEGSVEGTVIGSFLRISGSARGRQVSTEASCGIDEVFRDETVPIEYTVPIYRNCLEQGPQICYWENECPDLYDTNLLNCTNQGGSLENWSCTENPNPPVYDYQCNIPECPQAYQNELSSCSSQGGQITNWSCSENPLDFTYQCELPSKTELDKNKGPDCEAEGNPCSPSSGNKFESVTDYISADGNLSVVRNYNSLNPKSSTFGTGWTSGTNYSLDILFSEIKVNQSTGRVETWNVDYEGPIFERAAVDTSNNISLSAFDEEIPPFETLLIGPQDTRLSLTMLDSNEYRLVDSKNSTYTFDQQGKLKSKVDSAGLVTNYLYNAEGLLETIIGPFGRQLSYEYNVNNLVEQIITPDGIIQYGYISGKLVNVTYPDNTTKTYHYENTQYPYALTGITDEKGVRYATWSYNEDGRVSSSEHAGGTDKVTFQYQTNNRNDVSATTVRGILGDERTYLFDIKHGTYKITSVTGDRCLECGNNFMRTRTYDANGFLSAYTDWEGTQTVITNNAKGLPLKRETFKNGSDLERVVDTVWHETLRLPISINHPNSKTEYTYTSSGKVLTKTVTDLSSNQSRTTTYTYHPTGTNGAGKVATIDGSRTDVNDVTSFTYNQKGELVSIVNPLGQTTSITSHDASGRPLLMTDTNGIVSAFEWDKRGRLTQQSVNGKATNFVYDAVGQLTRVTQADGSLLNYQYNDARRLVSISDNLNNRIVYTYDAMGNRVNTQRVDENNVIAFAQSRVFNKLSLLKQVVGSNGQQIEYNYDANDNLVSQTDTLNRQTQNQYDILDRLTKSIDPDAKETQFEYDLQDNLTKVIDARNLETSYEYNGFDEVVRVSSPDTGMTTYTYDSAGNIINKTDARGISVAYNYDALNRLLLEDYLDDTHDVSYTYDSALNGKGRLATRENGVNKTSYQYDTQGNVVSMETIIQGKLYTTQYQYNDANRLTSITYPNRTQVNYQLDSTGRVVSIESVFAGISKNIVSLIDYLPLDVVNQLTFGNSLIENRSFDQSLRLNQVTVGSLLSRQYLYDSVDNVSNINNDLDANANLSYFYDTLDRIIIENGDYGTREYSYDAVSNRSQRIKDFQQEDEQGNLIDVTGRQNYSYVLDANQLIKINNQDITYDAVGNTTSTHNGNRLFTYNAVGRLDTFTKNTALKANYHYNGKGERVVKIRHKDDGTTSTFHFHYDQQGKLLSETKYDKLDRKRLVREYIWLNDRPVAQIKTRYKTNGDLKDRKVVYIHTDHLDAPSIATDETQQIVWEWNHDAFGLGSPDRDPDADDSKVNIPLRFPGQYKDGESGLMYNYYRYYNPKTGRYITSDPIGLQGGINTYVYVENNPLNLIDPLGLAPIPTDNFHGFPRAFWNWFHNTGDMNSLKGPDGQVPKEIAEEYFEEWKDQGRPSPRKKGKDKRDRRLRGLGPTTAFGIACELIGPNAFNPFCQPEPLPFCEM